MARYKTKKQKKLTHKVLIEKTPAENQVKSQVKNQTTVFSKSQVNLLYRDLGKTLLVTIVVFFVLLLIFLYMR